MTEVSGGQAGVLLVELAGEKDVFLLEGPDFDAEIRDQFHSSIKGLVSTHRHENMHQLLQHFRRSAQRNTILVG